MSRTFVYGRRQKSDSFNPFQVHYMITVINLLKRSTLGIGCEPVTLANFALYPFHFGWNDSGVY